MLLGSLYRQVLYYISNNNIDIPEDGIPDKVLKEVLLRKQVRTALKDGQIKPRAHKG